MPETATTGKPRDKRTHDEKIAALREAFERFKARAIASGKVNDCSVSKVCERARVRDVYLYKDKLKDASLNQRYHNVKNDITDFREKFSENIEQQRFESELGLAIKAKEDMEAQRDAAHKLCSDALEQVQSLKKTIRDKNKQLKVHQNLATDIAYSGLQQQVIKEENQLAFTAAKIVSPDNGLYKNGKYDFHDKNRREAAWRSARHELETLLKRPLPIRVYMLVGAPNSGKTHWCGESHYYKDRHPVVIDATNLTKSARSAWFNLIYKYKYKHHGDIKVCAVFFDVLYVRLMERNNQRSADRRIPDDVLQKQYEELEPVDVFEDFDEIMVVKHG